MHARTSQGRARRWWLPCLLCAAVLACDDGTPMPAESDDEGSEPPAWPLPRECVAPEGLGRPASIEQVVALVNALPKPTTLPCVLESLDRPLQLYASTSTAGAQPADGPDSPRIFLFEGPLAMSVVPRGTGSETLELSSAIGDRLSIKAELLFPVDEMLADSAPYDQVDLGEGSTCGTCHGSETRVDTIDFADAWASDMYQDEPEQALSLSFLRQSALDCNRQDDPQRCEMLDALFGHGDVVPGDLARDSLVCRAL
ncbi:MAG: hypothetical protein AB1Z98_12555 [Nannocystaceae bacterium]